ncbi:ubiquinol-cytochrome c reductase iron-sulfur subunit [Colwellia sp. PAMC 20917]|jgi:ubiquinol-cytochrome c reductase iron-sulfur subunit|uniref:ubiquinol-cytochrome c reductase iron-sulfur subunit n=1 Tax=unclassified Colwellia TaxID=196834 RepID=UPI00087811D4|nr:MULTISPECIES: ubiquinol-cytochrome c reductase iron-sulfur subunit [unclassified Colwellia]MBA6362497.1 ubiquinol-cytochrome c reductase iron-sulfur subunit [Colwellia sp. BRX8-8]AOW77730.1 ubiquinol-cytochrome c reductase iron-sulfur subunit [Colwellia sp. PAMC 20917]MBA6336916.1 ubiquinol-cytochrome c reductase iron-sulfur subunit [Colwellia sp. BRX8-7]MBA6348212.1 ubiquinol-cytochrome c reductase iron-sulfur subunit [Colwellia sp. BRX8-9]MBA6351396.1 ubiquinol-cytochrome c reductase iron|tara:strand:+ start:610 stop:1200 length:591 start_codon:yes stop_codon:yes gene_type:complete
MSNAPVNNGRRRFLTAATSVVGGVGVVGLAVPFIGSWNPSARAKAAGAPVEVNVSKIEPGQLIRAEWRGKPVYVVRRTEEILSTLAAHDDQLKDPGSEEPQQPTYAANAYRSIKPEFMVALGVCTHLGCAPTHHQGDFEEFVEGVKDGFFCPCHGSKFDMAGRVFQSVPAPTNLVVPEHSFPTADTLLIGVSAGEA